MKLSTLKKKYPNTFHKFYTSRFCENYYLRIANVPILETDVRNHWKEITDFMDKQGIILETEYSDIEGFTACINYKICGEWTYSRTGYTSSRHQAETKGLEKCFQILEERSRG